MIMTWISDYVWTQIETCIRPYIEMNGGLAKPYLQFMHHK